MDQERLSESEPPPGATVQIEGRETGPPRITVTVHAADVAEAARLAREQYDALVQQYATPANGTHPPDVAPPPPAGAAAPISPEPRVQPPLLGHVASEQVAPNSVTPEQAEPAPGVQVHAGRVGLAGSLSGLATRVDRDVLALGAAGVLLSWLAWTVIYAHGSQPLVWDANEYYGLAKQLTQTGLGNWSNPQRTYAFPYFVSAFVWMLGDNWVRVQQAASFVAWLINLGVGAALGWATARLTGSRGDGLLAYGLIALNPFLLAQTTALLSDSLSASMIAVAVIPVVAGWQRGLRTTSVGWLMVASLFCASVATEIRPGNIVIMPAIVVLWIVRAIWFRSYPWRWLPLVLVGLVLPLLPQMLANQRDYGTPQPLTVATGLLDDSIRAGLTRLKSRTSVVPNKPAQLNYENPFYRPAARTFPQFFALSPAGALATMFIHGFALVDIDLPYTYVFDYHPWYRWPLSLLSSLFWLLAVVGAATALIRAVRLRTIEPTTWVVLAPVVVAFPYLALYLTLGPDVRYGAPLYLLAVPAVGAGLAQVRGSARQSRNRAVGWLAATAIVMAGCAALSAWISQQAPSLWG